MQIPLKKKKSILPFQCTQTYEYILNGLKLASHQLLNVFSIIIFLPLKTLFCFKNSLKNTRKRRNKYQNKLFKFCSQSIKKIQVPREKTNSISELSVACVCIVHSGQSGHRHTQVSLGSVTESTHFFQTFLGLTRETEFYITCISTAHLVQSIVAHEHRH